MFASSGCSVHTGWHCKVPERRTYHFDYIKRLTDEDLVAHIGFERSDKTEREQACFEMNLCDTPGRPRGQVLYSFITHGRRKERKERTKEKETTPMKNALDGMSEPAYAG